MSPRKAGRIELPARGVDLSKVEGELALLRAPGAPAGPQAVFRACSLNLVAVASSARRVAAAADAAAAISDRFPSRVVTVLYEPGSRSPELTGAVGGHCRLTEGGRRQVCCELVSLTARGHLAEHLPSALATLAAPDLPTWLWWLAPLDRDDPLLGRLPGEADVFLTDSDGQADPAGSVVWLDRFGYAAGRRGSTADLAWHRLEEWRREVMALFDRPLPGLAPPDIDAITVRYAGDPPPASALFMGGWLTRRLGWVPLRTEARASGWSATMERPGGQGMLHLAATAEHGPSIESITFSAGRGRKRLSVVPGSTSCHPGRTPRAGVRGESGRFRPVALDELLCRALSAPLPDQVFSDALRQASLLVQALAG